MSTTRAAPEVVLSHGGRLRGAWDGDVRAFKGVRFARAPFGELRFEAPCAEPPWTGTRDAAAFGPAFLQWPRDTAAPHAALGAQDALRLNVWAPEAPPGARLPVMVWVHGGGYFRGASSEPLYDGASFARQGIVFVSVQYRLGVDGFAHLPTAPANRGLLDLLASLRWVSEFVAAWGGDPQTVTVAGQSAGAGAIACLMGMPASRGLFHRVVLQSPSIACQSLDEATAACKAIATLAGIAPTRAAMTAAPTTSLLRAVHLLASDPQLRKAHGMGSRNIFPLRPVVDGECLLAPPLEGIAREWQTHRTALQILVGSNAEEMRLYHVPGGALQRLTQADLEDFVRDAGLEMPDEGEGPAAQLCALQSSYYYGTPARQLAQLATVHAQSTHRYLFSWRSPQYGGQLGAAHGVELPFVFQSLESPTGRDLAGPAAPRELALQMHEAWGRFAREGDPGWQASTRQHPWTKTFDWPINAAARTTGAKASVYEI